MQQYELNKWKLVNPLWYLILKYPEKPWNWRLISKNPIITWDIIRTNPKKPWNPNITKRIKREIQDQQFPSNFNSEWHDASRIAIWEHIKSTSEKSWHWRGVSKNPNVTWDIIQENPGKPWYWSDISLNPNVTWDIIQENPGKRWDWYGITVNPNITWDIIMANPNKPWKYNFLYRNKNITLELLLNNLDKPWVSKCISSKSDITLEIIENNLEKIDWNALSKNKFILIRKMYKQQQLKLGLFVLNNLPSNLSKIIVHDYSKKKGD